MVPAGLGFSVLSIASFPGSELWKITVCFSTVSFGEKGLIWLAPAGDRFLCSGKLCSHRARGRGGGKSVGKAQWVTRGKKNGKVRIKEIKHVFNTSDICDIWV